MASLAEFRKQHPEYANTPDAQLADGLYRKFYAHMPRDEFDRKIGIEPPNMATDMATGFGAGVVRGTAAMAGSGGDAANWLGWLGGEGYRLGKSALATTGYAAPATDDDVASVSTAVRRSIPVIGNLLSTDELRQAGTDLTGITLPTPQTTAGRYAQAVGEFVPAVASGSRGLWELGRRGAPAALNLVSDLAKYAVAPGIASEAAGQATEGGAWEPWARAGAALGAGGIAALASRPSTPVAALRETGGGKNLREADVRAAGRLMGQAHQRGVTLTWPEALAQVTKGRVDMTDVQRVLEQSPGGRPVMNEFMSRRPDQVRGAMDAEIGGFGPQGNPVRTGIDIQRQSADTLRNLRERINNVTRPLYQAAGPVSVNPARFQVLTRDPLFQAALKDVRANPVYARALAGAADDSVQVFDAVKKYLDDVSSAASTGGRNFEASAYGGLARDVRTEAQAASPAYSQALDMQARYRQGVLEPAQTGPLGRMAETPDIRTQINAVFPSNPTAGSERVVGQTIRRLVRQNPQNAAQLVRTHLETAFNEAVQANVGGANQWGGAKAAAQIIGNRQQEANLRAAIEALPGGHTRWQGLRRLMQVFEATGKRQRPGSMTDFNNRIREDMGRGGMVGRGATLATSPSSALTFLNDWYTRFRLGKNTEALARIITDPGNQKLFNRLAMARTISDRQRAAAVLLYEGQLSLRRPAE